MYFVAEEARILVATPGRGVDEEEDVAAAEASDGADGMWKYLHASPFRQTPERNPRHGFRDFENFGGKKTVIFFPPMS